MSGLREDAYEIEDSPYLNLVAAMVVQAKKDLRCKRKKRPDTCKPYSCRTCRVDARHLLDPEKSGIMATTMDVLEALEQKREEKAGYGSTYPKYTDLVG